MLTPIQLQRLHHLVQPYIEEMPEVRAIDNAILLFDVCETMEFSAGEMKTIFGGDALSFVTELVYGKPGERPAALPPRHGAIAL